MMHIFKPDGTGKRSSLAFTVDVPGHPSTPSFYPTDNVKGGADFIACMPLTSNPNKNQIKASTGEIACEYYNGCTNPTTLDDIDHGVCLHTSVENAPDQLTRVTEAVADGLCPRCDNQANFEDDGACTCTPTCGSCDKDFETDLSMTGVACVDLGRVVDGFESKATLIPNAGAVKQGSPYGSSPECTYGRTYRAHKRGKHYDASVSNFPTDSIVIVDMATQELKCQVDVDGAPSRIVWAPNEPVKLSDTGKNASDASILVRMPAILIAGILAMLMA
jgi:hypothetical protein